MTSQRRHTHGFSGRSSADTFSAAETAARELGTLSLSDARSLCRLYERDRDPWLERAMRIGSAGCGASVRSPHKQVGLLGAAGPLRTEFRQLALNVLLTTRGELGRAAPTLRRSRPVRL